MRGLGLILVLATITAACASGGVVRPAPVPTGPTGGGPPPAPGEGRSDDGALGHRIVADALALRGVAYRNGGADPTTGFDCSGFVRYVLARHGIAAPRQTAAQFAAGTPVAPGDLRPGDLIFFSTVAPGASHVGIAIDDDEFVHAPSSRGVVRVERLALPYWQRRFLGVRRLR